MNKLRVFLFILLPLLISAAAHAQSTVHLTWNASVTPGVSYDIYRGVISGGPYTQLSSAISTLTYDDSTGLAGSTYYYVVRSLLQGMESVNSNEVSVTLPSISPTPPTNLNGQLNQSTAASAAFLRVDNTTQGNWLNLYGAEGYILEGISPHLPTYATLTTTNALTYQWAANTTDPRALSIPNTSSRIASVWYNPSSFDFDLNLTDGLSHQLTLYATDWDSTGRTETIQILNTNGALLDSRMISNFSGGAYLTWTLSGHVTIHVTRTNGPNAVINAFFFGN